MLSVASSSDLVRDYGTAHRFWHFSSASWVRCMDDYSVDTTWRFELSVGACACLSSFIDLAPRIKVLEPSIGYSLLYCVRALHRSKIVILTSNPQLYIKSVITLQAMFSFEFTSLISSQ